MALKVFIPTAKTQFATVDDGGVVHLNPEWYLFFSEKLNSDSLLLGGGTFATDQNVLTNQSFSKHIPVPTMTVWGDSQNILAGQIFGA